MPISLVKKELIAREVINTLVSRFDNFPDESSINRNAPFHDAFLKAFADKLQYKVSDTNFMISLNSWLHGLNTTIGQNFFENVAHHLCDGEKREYTSGRLGIQEIPLRLKNKIDEIHTSFGENTNKPNLLEENSAIKHILDNLNNNDKIVHSTDFSTDVYFETEENIIAIELKSVKPNSGQMKLEKLKILEGKSALMYKNPNKNVCFYIGFPFDPTVDISAENPCSYNKTRLMDSVISLNKYFAPEEVLIASELWNLLSGSNGTMEEILEIINTIATPQFMDKFTYLLENRNRNKARYREILDEWYLKSEIELLDRDEEINQAISGNTTLNRVYNKTPFNNKGIYNSDRYYKLINLIK